jgi:hypothetical protein
MIKVLIIKRLKKRNNKKKGFGLKLIEITLFKTYCDFCGIKTSSEQCIKSVSIKFLKKFIIKITQSMEKFMNFFITIPLKKSIVIEPLLPSGVSIFLIKSRKILGLIHLNFFRCLNTY